MCDTLVSGRYGFGKGFHGEYMGLGNMGAPACKCALRFVNGDSYLRDATSCESGVVESDGAKYRSDEGAGGMLRM